MGLFNFLFGQHNSLLADSIWHDKDFTKQNPNIVINFFIPDKIDYDKFALNEYANNNIDIYNSNKAICTKSYNRFILKHHRGIGVPDWFYIAYPDVAKWMETDFSNVTIGLDKPPYLVKDSLTLKFFRSVIDRFKTEGCTLECSR